MSSNDKKFIKGAIKRPGELRGKAANEGGLDKKGKIKLAWAEEKAKMKPKSDMDKLTKQQAAFYVNVLHKAKKLRSK